MDDQQDYSDIRLSFYPVLQVISLRCNKTRERQYNVKLTNESTVMSGILMEDEEDPSPVDNLLRLFDVISVKRHKNMKQRDKNEIYIWHIVQFSVIDKSHSSAIGMESIL